MVPHPYPQCSLVLSRPDTMVQLFYFVCACITKTFRVRKLLVLLTTYFFSSHAKYPFEIRKIQIMHASPPFIPKHKHTIRLQCIPCVQANMGAIGWIFCCSVRIIQSHVSKWYSTTKSAKYARQNSLVILQTQETLIHLPLMHHPFPILLSPAICLLPGPRGLPNVEPLGIQPPVHVVVPKHLCPPLPLCSACPP